MRYDYTRNGVTRTVARPATGCLYLDGVSIPPGATDAQLAALGLVPHVDPPPAPPVDPQTLKSPDLKSAENRYILFCRSLGLPDKASTAQLESLAVSLPELQGLQIGVRALALINDVMQNGGTWDGIAWHPEVES